LKVTLEARSNDTTVAMRTPEARWQFSEYHSPIKETWAFGELDDSTAELGKICDECIVVPESEEMYTERDRKKGREEKLKKQLN